MTLVSPQMTPRFLAVYLLYLRPANAKTLGYLGLRNLVLKGVNLAHLFFGKLGLPVVFALQVDALTRAKAVAVIVAAMVWHKFLTARVALFGHVLNAAVFVGVVHFHVLATADYLKILYAVIGLIAVLVMHYLIIFQRASKMLTHDETVLKNVPAFAGVRVIGAGNQNVGIMRFSLTTVPPGIRGTTVPVPRQIANLSPLLKAVISRFANFGYALSAPATALNINWKSLFVHVGNYTTHGATSETRRGAICS